jgi:hypothetical protein
MVDGESLKLTLTGRSPIIASSSQKAESGLSPSCFPKRLRPNRRRHGHPLLG